MRNIKKVSKRRKDINKLFTIFRKSDMIMARFKALCDKLTRTKLKTNFHSAFWWDY